MTTTDEAVALVDAALNARADVAVLASRYPDGWRIDAADEIASHARTTLLSAIREGTANKAEVEAMRVERSQIEALTNNDQGDDDGPQIMPDYDGGASLIWKVEAMGHLLEKRRDVIAGQQVRIEALQAEVKRLTEERDARLLQTHIPVNELRAAETALTAEREENRKLRKAVTKIAKWATSEEMRACLAAEAAKYPMAAEMHAHSGLADFEGHYNEAVELCRRARVKEST